VASGRAGGRVSAGDAFPRGLSPRIFFLFVACFAPLLFSETFSPEEKLDRILYGSFIL
jgi:hypothetical protein